LARKLENWIESYEEYTSNTESAKIFHRWCALSAVASVLRRKVWFEFGRISIYPNLYIILVADPGIARKTQAISFQEEILSQISGIVLSADATTPQALMDDLEEAASSVTMADNTSFTHCSLTICSGEFESFIGGKKDNERMIITLTDLFDCKQRPYKTRTRHSKSNIIPHPFLNLIAATTPDSIANSLPPTAIGGGLTSRIIFIWAAGKEKKIDVPELNPSAAVIREQLITDLAAISRISGPYRFSHEGRDWWRSFYMSFEEQDPKRICKDNAFKGWYSRKPLFIIKVAMILTAAKTQSTIVEPAELELSLQYIEEAESTMVRTFNAVGRSDVAADVDNIRQIVRQHGFISESKLMQLVWRDADARKFDLAMATIIRTGEIQRSYQGPNNEKGIHYIWTGGTC